MEDGNSEGKERKKDIWGSVEHQFNYNNYLYLDIKYQWGGDLLPLVNNTFRDHRSLFYNILSRTSNEGFGEGSLVQDGVCDSDVEEHENGRTE